MFGELSIKKAPVTSLVWWRERRAVGCVIFCCFFVMVLFFFLSELTAAAGVDRKSQPFGALAKKTGRRKLQL